MTYDPDAQRFRDYAEGHTDESPVDLSGREGAPRSDDFDGTLDMAEAAASKPHLFEQPATAECEHERLIAYTEADAGK